MQVIGVKSAAQLHVPVAVEGNDDITTGFKVRDVTIVVVIIIFAKLVIGT